MTTNFAATKVASNAYVKHIHEISHFLYHGSGSCLLVEAPPQALIIAVYPSAAARFSIAFNYARARFVFENIFELDVDIVLFMWYTSDTRTNFLNRFAITTSYFC